MINQTDLSIVAFLKDRKIGFTVLLSGVILVFTSLLFKSEVVYIGVNQVPLHQTLDGDLYQSARSKAFLFFNSSFYFSILSSLLILIVGLLCLIKVDDRNIRNGFEKIPGSLSDKIKSFTSSFNLKTFKKKYRVYASKHTKTIKDFNEKEFELYRLQQIKERRLEQISNWVWILLFVVVFLISILYNSRGSMSLLGLFLFISIIPQLVRVKANRSGLFISLWFIGLIYLVFMVINLSIDNYIIEKLNMT